MRRGAKVKKFFIAVIIAFISTVAAGGNLSGNGTQASPYLIKNISDFDSFADPSNAGTYWASDVHTKIMCDIDLSGRIYTNAVIAPETTNSVYYAFDGIAYSGIFDGNSKVVRNLTIETVVPSSGPTINDFLGLFGQISGENAAIKNLGLENVDIEGKDFSDFIGGICGENSGGTITNCYVIGNIAGGYDSEKISLFCGSNAEGATISDSYATGCLSGGGEAYYVGSLCGYNDGQIIECSSSGSITIKPTSTYYSWNIGGFCGKSSGSIQNSYSDCVVNAINVGIQAAGGFCGCNIGQIIKCYSTGYVSGGSNCGDVGGFCGFNSAWSGGTALIQSSYSTGNITCGNKSTGLGGFCGNNSEAEIYNSYSRGIITTGNKCRQSGGFCGTKYYDITENCYSTGSITTDIDSYYIGGFSGRILFGTTTNNCAWDIESSGIASSADGIGKTTSEMKTIDTFTDINWDFTDEATNGTDDIWRMCVNGINYPRLSWEFIQGDVSCPDGVSLIDFAVFSQTWNCSVGQFGYKDKCDLNGDSTINILDLTLFAENWLVNN